MLKIISNSQFSLINSIIYRIVYSTCLEAKCLLILVLVNLFIFYFIFRLTKLEVQSTDKLESVRSELRDIARRWQQQEWQSSRTDSALDALRTDLSFLRQIAEIRPQNPTVGGILFILVVVLQHLLRDGFLQERHCCTSQQAAQLFFSFFFFHHYQ